MVRVSAPPPPPEDLAVRWERMVASSLERARTTTSARGIVPIRPRPCPEPDLRARPEFSREPHLVKPALDECLKALACGKAPWPLYLHGPAGGGKTAAALCLLDHCGPAVASGKRAPEAHDPFAGYWDARKSAALKVAADEERLWWSRDGLGGTTSWGDLLRAVRQAPLVVFDEAGAAANEFAASMLLEAVDQRDGHPVRPFVFVSNHRPADLCRLLDDRLCSRVLCGTVFHLDAPDRRRAVRPAPKS